MITLIAYLVVLFLLIIFLLSTIIFTSSLFYSSIMGAPYIPSRQKEVEFALSQISFAKNKTFIDLGCGDGRTVRTAVKLYGVKGIGVDINPLLIFYGKILSRLKGVNKNITLITENIYKINLSKIDYVYIFLMPATIEKLRPIMEKQLPKKAIVISHGFPVIGWDKKMFKKVSHIPFPTYFYRM
ncbi:MAG: class I SAM-dependent methyltransferase [bacterium]|nr:class I SAM-dependent methyltransferase [bacterium]